MRQRMTVFIALALGLSLVLTACEEEPESFDSAVGSGAPCSELFDIRNSWDPKSELIESANEVLRDIGCYSASSERTD